MRKILLFFILNFSFVVTVLAQDGASESKEGKSAAKKTSKKTAKKDKDKTEKSKDGKETKKTKTKKGQSGLIVVEGAMVYESASFDSSVIAYLPINKKVQLSSKTYGPFYKVKLKKSTYGYISDVDVQVTSKAATATTPTAANTKKKGPTAAKDKEVEKFNKPLPALEQSTNYGFSLGSLFYSEEIMGQAPVTGAYLVYGLKFTGPKLLLPMTMDWSINMSMSPPPFLGDSYKPTGYLVLGDGVMVIPFLLSSPNVMSYLGLGGFIANSSLKYVEGGTVKQSGGTRFGVAGSVGLAFRLNKIVWRLEGKYYYDKTPFGAAFLGVQYSAF